MKELNVAIEIIDGLIAKDAVNMAFRRIRLTMMSDYGRLLAEQGDIPAALNIYQSTLDQASRPGAFSDETLTEYAVGWLSEDIGDCYIRLAAKLPATSIDRKKNIERAESYYKTAAEHLGRTDVRRVYFSRTPELLDYLERKLKGSTNSM
jgi:hypothetical protein